MTDEAGDRALPGPPPGAKELLFSGFKGVFKGVSHGVGCCNVAVRDVGIRRIQRVNAFKIDLLADGIDFVTTALSEQATASMNGCTKGSTVTGFMSANSQIMVAMNANFTYCEHMNDRVDADYGILGCVISREAVVCDPGKPGWSPTDTPSNLKDVEQDTDSGAKALILRKRDPLPGYVGSIETVKSLPGLDDPYLVVAGGPEPAPGQDAYAPKNAIRESMQLVENGRNKANTLLEGPRAKRVAARAGIGLDAAGTTLYFAVLDGCEDHHPEYGGDYCDIAQWLITVGAYNAINVDGGGSAVVAMRTSVLHKSSTGATTYTLGSPSVLSIPYGDEHTGPPACQRPLGVFLGVIARPRDTVA